MRNSSASSAALLVGRAWDPPRAAVSPAQGRAGRVRSRRPELTQQVAEVQAPRDTLHSGSADPRFPPGTIRTAEVSKTKED